ncbi:MAG: hypothetical protein GXO10_04915 [Crenarchaeota archaeon]|nr:hypothetical protein [Thermoproteota archaeon]
MAVTIKNVQSLIPSTKRLFRKVAIKWAKNDFVDIVSNKVQSVNISSAHSLPLVINYLRKPSKNSLKIKDFNPETINHIFKTLWNAGQVISPVEVLMMGLSILDKTKLTVFVETKEYNAWDMNLLLNTLVPNLTLKYNIVPYMIWEAERGPFILNRIFDNFF